MTSRYRSLAVYSLLLAAGAGAWLAHELLQAPDFPSLWVALFGIAASLFPEVAGLRALHNAAMTALMLLLAGATYQALGGR